jgi:hypothetical protein
MDEKVVMKGLATGKCILVAQEGKGKFCASIVERVTTYSIAVRFTPQEGVTTNPPLPPG